MSVPAPTRVGMPMDEFIRLYDEAPFELIDGERVALPLQLAGHAVRLKRLYDALLLSELNGRNHIVFSRMPFILVDGFDWITTAYRPDAMVYTTSRMEAYKSETACWKDKPFSITPDLCIEVIAPNEKYVLVERKLSAYLNLGVRRVWLVDESGIFIHSAETNKSTRCRINDVIIEADILPDFSIAVRDIFA